jgi:hypothetical protein
VLPSPRPTRLDRQADVVDDRRNVPRLRWSDLVTLVSSELAMRPLPAFILCAAFTAAHATPEAPRPGHPLVGIWELRVPDAACTEIYRFRGDGTALVTSRQEVSESEYHVRAEPDAEGFYALDDRVIKNNGKEDCIGETVKAGAAVRNYLRFHPSGDMFLMCFQETMGSCIGPFRRVQGAGA